MFDLEGKVAVITGGAKGIGAAAVRRFLEEGAKFVAFIDVDEESGIVLEQRLLKKHGKDVLKFFKCDVTSDEELSQVFDYTIKHYGYIDVVLNNAAVTCDDMHKREIAINFTAVVTITLKALGLMRKDRGGTGGTIINVSSVGALSLQKDPSIYVYCATKGAVLLFSSNLGMEGYYSHTGVRVITMCFGLTSTDIIRNLKGIDEICTTQVNKSVNSYKSQSIIPISFGVIYGHSHYQLDRAFLLIKYFR